MATEFNLTVNKRNISGKSKIKNMRRENKIPGIYYSHDSKQSISLYINSNDLISAQKSDAKIFTINVGNKKRNVLFKSVQYHPVTDEILHVDLYGIKMDQLVSVNIGVELIGTPKGVIEEGGILTQGIADVEIECLPNNIPGNIQIDVSDLSLGEVLRVQDITKQKNVTIKTNEDQIIASITQAMKEEVVEEEIIEIDDEEGDSTEEDSSEEQSEKPDKNNKEESNE